MRYKSTISKAILIGLCLFAPYSLWAQEKEAVQWLTFEELEQALAEEPKKVFIDFYTDWCTYCRKMDRKVFTKPSVINLLNDEYYAVRFDAETAADVNFGGQRFINDQLKSSRTPVHQIAQILATREGQFVPPAMLVLDESFKVTARYFEYLDSKSLLTALDTNPSSTNPATDR